MATATKKFPPASPLHNRVPRSASHRRPCSIGSHGLIDAIYRFLASLKLAVFSISHAGGDPGLRDVLRVVVWRRGGAGVHLPQPGVRDPAGVSGDEHPVRGPDPLPVEEAADRVRGHARRALDPACRLVLQRANRRRRTGRHARGGREERAGPYRLSRDPGLGGRSAHPGAHSRVRPAVSSRPVRVGAGEASARRFCSSACSRSSRSGCSGPSSSAEEVLSKPGDPFRFVVKEHLPASAPAVAHVADPDGAPMVRLGLQFKGPGMPQAQDAFRSEEDHWFATEKKFYRVVRSQPPALMAFSYVDRPELVDDFLKPPPDAGAKGVARFRYQDRSGKTRVFDWALDGQARQVGRPARERPDRHALRGDGVSDQHRPARIRSWETTRSRSPCSRSRRARTSRSPTWHWPTCRWSPT